jgi:hypothetical protein
VRSGLVPDDLSAPSFLATVAEAVLSRTPIDMHVAVRELREQRDLDLEEVDESADRNA